MPSSPFEKKKGDSLLRYGRLFLPRALFLSKKILTLGLKDEPQPRPKVLQLQRMVRYSATLFVQVNAGPPKFSMGDEMGGNPMRRFRFQDQRRTLVCQRLLKTKVACFQGDIFIYFYFFK